MILWWAEVAAAAQPPAPELAAGAAQDAGPVGSPLRYDSRYDNHGCRRQLGVVHGRR